MKFLSNEQLGSLCAICSGLSYGLVGYFGISLMSDLSVFNMLFWRFLVTSLLMGIILLPRYALMKFSKGSLKVLLYGALYSGSAMFYFISGKYIGTGLAMVIVFTHPAIVILINWVFYKIKISKIYYVAVPALAIGMLLLVDMSKFKFDILGIAFGVLSAIFYAFYIVENKKSKVPPLVSTLMVSIGCAITCLIFSFIDCSFFIPLSLKHWMNIMGISIICTALPILLLLQALKYISSQKAAMLSVLEPVFVVVFGIILLGETISIVQVVGATVVLTSALITLFGDRLAKNLFLQ